MEKWRDWAKRIRQDVCGLVELRGVWRGIRETVEEHKPGVPLSPLLWFMSYAYAHAAAAAIRRHARTDKRGKSIPLRRLLEELRAQAQCRERCQKNKCIDETYFVERYMEASDKNPDPRMRKPEERKYFEDTARQKFRRVLGCAKGWLVSAQIANDLWDLAEATGGISAYMDKAIAHLDDKPPEPLPTYEELNPAIDVIAELARRYCSLVEGKDSSATALTPSPGSDWRRAFAACCQHFPATEAPNKRGCRGEG